MKSKVLNEEMIRKKLAFIIKEVGNIEIGDDENSLFDFQHNLSADSLVYVLLRASKEFSFEINDEFVNSLGDYSFQSLISSLMNHGTNQVANSNI